MIVTVAMSLGSRNVADFDIFIYIYIRILPLKSRQKKDKLLGRLRVLASRSQTATPWKTNKKMEKLNYLKMQISS